MCPFDDSLLDELEAPGTEGAPQPPNLAAARACVNWMTASLLRLNKKAGLQDNQSAFVHDLVLGSASQAAILWRIGSGRQARTSLVNAWFDQASMVSPGSMPLPEYRTEWSVPAWKLQPTEVDHEFLILFNLAVSEKLHAESAEAQARQALRNVQSRLDLSLEELAQMLRASKEDVIDWESGRTSAPRHVRPALGRASSAVRRLLALFRPQRLPEVIRREVPLFDGRSALAWILEGRIEEVAQRYERALAYQG